MIALSARNHTLPARDISAIFDSMKNLRRYGSEQLHTSELQSDLASSVLKLDSADASSNFSTGVVLAFHRPEQHQNQQMHPVSAANLYFRCSAFHWSIFCNAGCDRALLLCSHGVWTCRNLIAGKGTSFPEACCRRCHDVMPLLAATRRISKLSLYNEQFLLT